MKLYQLLIPAYVLLVLVFSPVGVEAAGLVPCGGLGEAPCQACHVTELINKVVAWLMLVLSIVAALLIMVAGFKLVTSGGNSGALTAAKETFTNILIGFLILFAGWILIDTLMKALLKDQVYGMWNAIQCVNQPGVLNAPAGSGLPSGVGTYTGPTGGGRGTGAQCGSGNLSCSVAALMNYGFSEEQANIMSCIAMTESTGNPNAVNPNGGACGTFQVLPSNWRNSRLHSGSCSSAVSCTNVECNARAALALINNRPANNRYGDWTCPRCNASAAGCVSRYSSPQP